MFSSNEKISGRQAFRLLVFDLLGLGTLLIPAAVAGFSIFVFNMHSEGK